MGAFQESAYALVAACAQIVTSGCVVTAEWGGWDGWVCADRGVRVAKTCVWAVRGHGVHWPLGTQADMSAAWCTSTRRYNGDDHTTAIDELRTNRQCGNKTKIYISKFLMAHYYCTCVNRPHACPEKNLAFVCWPVCVCARLTIHACRNVPIATPCAFYLPLMQRLLHLRRNAPLPPFCELRHIHPFSAFFLFVFGVSNQSIARLLVCTACSLACPVTPSQP